MLEGQVFPLALVFPLPGIIPPMFCTHQSTRADKTGCTTEGPSLVPLLQPTSTLSDLYILPKACNEIPYIYFNPSPIKAHKPHNTIPATDRSAFGNNITVIF
jgi:hypothetical protein